MLTISGRHNRSQVFCDVVLMPVERLDGAGILDTHEPLAPKVHILKALIDTGAQVTSITPAAAQKLELSPIGMKDMVGMNGTSSHPSYLFKIGFISHKISGDYVFESETVIPDRPIEGVELGFDNANFDILLGMDIISHGNLLVSGNGTYKFDFHA